tara:strand:- start:558 stop:692 length:135 start_codon:yes stop_codon:yes gene_type:complete
MMDLSFIAAFCSASNAFFLLPGLRSNGFSDMESKNTNNNKCEAR